MFSLRDSEVELSWSDIVERMLRDSLTVLEPRSSEIRLDGVAGACRRVLFVVLFREVCARSGS